jgi:hypothetical protein
MNLGYIDPGSGSMLLVFLKIRKELGPETDAAPPEAESPAAERRSFERAGEPVGK